MKLINVGIIGLGVIGKRMAQNMGVHPKFNILGGYDISEKKKSEFSNEFPEIKTYSSAENLLRETELDLLYIGTPPASHAEYVKMSASRKLAIFCEKPLCVDDSQGSELVKIVESNKIFNAVNFVYSSAPAAEGANEYISSGELGDPIGIDISLTFSRWPRKWQEDAAWLAESEEGGFMREVSSHFFYLSYRLLGLPKWVGTPIINRPNPKAAEVFFQGSCTIDDIPLTINGCVGGKVNDIVVWRLRGTRSSLRIFNWYHLERQGEIDSSLILSEAESKPQAAYMAQLDKLAKQLNNEKVSLADFNDAFQIQKLVEEGLHRSIQI